MPFLSLPHFYVAVRCLHNEGMKVELEHYVCKCTNFQYFEVKGQCSPCSGMCTH